MTLKQGDLEPDLKATLRVAGQALNLTGATSVTARVRKPDDTVWTRGMTIVSATGGTASLAWASGDTDLVGRHVIEVFVTWSSGEVQTFPSKGSAYFNVTSKIS